MGLSFLDKILLKFINKKGAKAPFLFYDRYSVIKLIVEKQNDF